MGYPSNEPTGSAINLSENKVRLTLDDKHYEDLLGYCSKVEKNVGCV
jgi:hypothetical protein